MVGVVSTLTRDDYLAAGLDLLADGGEAAVTIAALCGRLGVTKGSFYHHFAGVEVFHEALLGFWEDGTARAIETARAVTDSRKRLAVLKELAVAAHHEAEGAIRAWGRSYEPAAAVVRRVDAAREANLVESFRAGREVRYRALGSRLSQTAHALERIGAEWDRRLSAIAAIAESLPER